MRFMIIVKASKDSEAGIMSSQKLLAEMGTFNEELIKAGILLAGEGLPHVQRDARHFFRKQAHCRRRSIHRDQGAYCRLLALEREIERRSDRVGEALSESAQ
jgi:hypothetical protein